ncbi:MAG: 50S ribosomal protein L22 [Patescibacteria group bacterium]|nr:50S ribosomal protein L22 [Patescibacteria group bacterium]
MNVSAQAKFIHMSPRKTRLVVNLVRGLSISEARRQLLFSKKDAAKPILKVLNSAVANAVNNLGVEESSLHIAQAFVAEGPTFYRYKPRAHGRAMPVRKRMSHITIEVSDGLEEVKKVEDVKAIKVVKEVKEVKKEKGTKAEKTTVE